MTGDRHEKDARGPTWVLAGASVGVPVDPRGPSWRPEAGMRLVLVEDNVDIRETLSELLALDGYCVASASDGPQGVIRIVAERPEVALVDVGLPGFDGYEVARRARERLGDELALIAMTGYAQDEDRERSLDAGFDDHVVKPVSIDELGAAIERTLRRKADGRVPAAGAGGS